MAVLEELRAARTDDRGARSPGNPSARRGRPLLMPREIVLERIRSLARSSDGLFRVHRRMPGFYARARRLFGSWSAAVAAAGEDYPAAVNAARERALRNRIAQARRRRRAAAG